MALKSIKIEHLERSLIKSDNHPWKDHSKSRKGLKKMRNRKLRRTPFTEKPATNRYTDYEF